MFELLYVLNEYVRIIPVYAIHYVHRISVLTLILGLVETQVFRIIFYNYIQTAIR